MTADPIWDDLFHGCSWMAFVQLFAETGGIPDSNATKRRAYAIYEAALNDKDKEPAPCDSPG